MSTSKVWLNKLWYLHTMDNYAMILKFWKSWIHKNQIGLKRYCQNKHTQTQGTQEHIEHMICVKKKGEE